MWSLRSLSRAIAAGAIVSSATFSACGDDPQKPGSLSVKWTHGPTPTCGTRGVTTIEARAMQKGVEIASASGDCATDAKRGAVTIPELKPGTYDVEVEALTAEGKGTYSAKAEKIAVREDQLTETAELRLDEKPARLRVDWLPPGGKCATAGITEVEVSLTYNAGTTAIVQAETTVPCDNVFASPTDPTVQLAGVLMADLPPNPDVVIFVYGKNAGGDRIAQGQAGPRAIAAGDDDAIVINLTTCEGSPPSCD
jgi:hypothetical protein